MIKSEKIEQNLLEKYQSLEFIDDISEDNDDLYMRSTNQNVTVELPEPLINHSHFLNHKSNMKQMNGFLHAEEFKLNAFQPREKHISISSNDHVDEDSHKHPNMMRQNSGRPFLFHTQLSQCSEAMTEAALAEDAVDAERYMRDMYPTCRGLIDRILTWDSDGDGLIENTGSPDQTFDAWIMTGPRYVQHTAACYFGNT